MSKTVQYRDILQWKTDRKS